MKYTFSFLFILVLLTASAAQQIPHTSTSPSATPATPEDVVIVKFSWSRHLNRPDWDKELYKTATDAAQADRNAHEARKNEIPRKEAQPHPSRRHGDKEKLPEVQQHQAEQGTASFHYRVTVKNAGKKTLRAVEWEYIFTDTEGQKEEARQTFVSRKKIKPGESKELLHTSTSPPSLTINAMAQGEGSHNQPVERVVITRIEYSDGSVWKRP